jgi:hypothetical protein
MQAFFWILRSLERTISLPRLRDVRGPQEAPNSDFAEEPAPIRGRSTGCQERLTEKRLSYSSSPVTPEPKPAL